MAATALALLVLSVLKWIEVNIPQIRHAHLDVVIEEDGPVDEELRAAWSTRVSRSIPGASRRSDGPGVSSAPSVAK